MPGTFASLDSGFPNINNAGSTEEKLRAIQDYLYQLLEQLRYTLNNLSQDNFNETETKQWLGTVVEEPIKIAVQNVEQDLSAQIDVAADEIRLGVKGGLANEWTVNKNYYLNDLVKVSTMEGGEVTAVTFYKAKNTTVHTSTAADKPGSGAQWQMYWDAIAEPSVQSVVDLNLQGVTISYDPAQEAANTPYITLNKDGTTIGGGPVYIGELSADTIKTGTLNAGNIVINESFVVQAKDENDEIHNCGYIGGTYNNAGYSVQMKSENGDTAVYATDDYALLTFLHQDTSPFKRVEAEVELSEYGAEITFQYLDNNVSKRKTLIVDSDGIYIKDGSNPKKNLFDLF